MKKSDKKDNKTGESNVEEQKPDDSLEEAITKEEKNEIESLRVNPVKANFALRFATSTVRKNLEQWAKEMNVSRATMFKWLKDENVKALIRQHQEQIKKETIDSFVDSMKKHGRQVMGKLLELIDNPRTQAEVRRKAISDYLGFMGVANVNRASIQVVQQQAQIKDTNMERFRELSEEEIDQKLEELNDFE